MKSYKYIARDSSGLRREGLRQGGSTGDVLAYLREQALTPISVSEMFEDIGKIRPHRHRKRVKSAELSSLCWQLTTMVKGGIPIIAALETIAEDMENSQLQEMLRQVREKMEKGETFSGSLSEFPNVFNRLSCAMILAGETGGTLSESLHRLAEYFDSRDKLAKKVKGAMAYPAFVFGFIVLIVTFIMAFIIPRFQIIFDQLGGELPAFTRGFMQVYDVLRHDIIYIIGSLLLVIIAGVISSKTRKGHFLFSRIALAIPLLGKVFSQAFIVMFCRTMSTLIGAGVSVLEIFDVLSGMTDNDVIKTAIIRTKEHIVEGSNISMSMAEAGFFPNMVVKMTQVGEESGSLSNVLDRTADYYERKVDSMITTATALLEPIMIVTTGAIVLVVVLALYLPIFSMSG